MTNTLLSLSPITAPVPCQYLIGNGRAPPPATLSAPFDRQHRFTQPDATVPIAPGATKTSLTILAQQSSLFGTEKSDRTFA
jgi:hypothetical protein